MQLNGAGPDRVVQELVERAHADMRGEGFEQDAVELTVSVHGTDGRPLVEGVAPDQVAAAGLPHGERLLVSVSATCAVLEAPLPTEAAGESEPEPKTVRRIVLPDGEHDAPVYARETLGAGARVAGPALIEATDTTYLVPAGSLCTIDALGTAQLTEEA